MLDHRNGPVGLVLAVSSAAAFGGAGTFATALLGAGWSAGAAVTVRMGVAALALTVPAVLQLRGRWPLLRAQAGAVLASAVAVTLYLASGRLPVAVVGIFLWGAVTALFLPPFYTLLQRATPADSHGRVMATAGTANGVAGLATTPLAGVAVGVVGIRTCALALAAGLVLAGTSGLWAAGQEEAKSESRAAASAG
ncbi:MAG TPA: hypothetical protein VKI19_12810 [Acidimicrobiales bacterium]|nr:hypothetical protein [Acidimicrobiales bacterium]